MIAYEYRNRKSYAILFFLLSFEMMERIGTIRYGNSIQGKIFISVFFALSALIGITLIISEELVDISTVGILWIIVSCVIYMILHECLHLLFMRMFSAKKLRVSFVFPSVSVSCEGLFPRKQFIAIASAPVLILGIILIPLLLFMPEGYAFLISILLTLNAAGSGGDFLQIFHAMRFPRTALFQDRGDETAVYSAKDLSTLQIETTD